MRPGAPLAPSCVWQELQSPLIWGVNMTRSTPARTTFARKGSATAVVACRVEVADGIHLKRRTAVVGIDDHDGRAAGRSVDAVAIVRLAGRGIDGAGNDERRRFSPGHRMTRNASASGAHRGRASIGLRPVLVARAHDRAERVGRAPIGAVARAARAAPRGAGRGRACRNPRFERGNFGRARRRGRRGRHRLRRVLHAAHAKIGDPLRGRRDGGCHQVRVRDERHRDSHQRRVPRGSSGIGFGGCSPPRRTRPSPSHLPSPMWYRSWSFPTTRRSHLAPHRSSWTSPTLRCESPIPIRLPQSSRSTPRPRSPPNPSTTDAASFPPFLERGT